MLPDRHPRKSRSRLFSMRRFLWTLWFITKVLILLVLEALFRTAFEPLVAQIF